MSNRYLHEHGCHAVTDEGAGNLVEDEFVGRETGALVVRPGLCAVTVLQSLPLVQTPNNTCVRKQAAFGA